MTGRLVSLNIGRAHTIQQNGRSRRTAIGKSPVAEPLWLDTLGLAGDTQIDTRHHGGPDKAVCCYPAERYPHWEQRLGRALPHPGFGENFITAGFLEEDVFIGDVFRVGSATVQVAQPRGPCATLAAFLQQPQLAAWASENGYTGWYLRVLEPGEVRAGDSLLLVERPGMGVSVMDVNRAWWDAVGDPKLTERVLKERLLAGKWLQQIEASAAAGTVRA